MVAREDDVSKWLVYGVEDDELLPIAKHSSDRFKLRFLIIPEASGIIRKHFIKHHDAT